MSVEKPHTIQIRVGPRTSANIRKWLGNQENPTESNKRILEHFTRLYGYGDIDSDEVQIGMARDLLLAKGETIQSDLGNDTSRKHEEEKALRIENTIEKPTDKFEEMKENKQEEMKESHVKEVKKNEGNSMLEDENKEVIPVNINRNISDLT